MHMHKGLHNLLDSPARIRVAPYVVFVLLMAMPDWLGPKSPFWIYTLRTAVGAAAIVWMTPRVLEMRWAWSWEAVAVGIAVFLLWIGIDPFVPAIDRAEGWNPNTVFGDGTPLAWFFIGVRLIGSTLVVPPLEEVFFRSFLYRYVAKQDFLSVPLTAFHPRPFVITCLVFGLIHHEWLAGILCGAAYQGLVLRRGRLGDAMTAHAITNCLLGLYIVSRGQWQFW